MYFYIALLKCIAKTVFDKMYSYSAPPKSIAKVLIEYDG